MKTNIMGVLFDNYTIDETADKAVFGDKHPFAIYTPNPEIVQIAKQDKVFLEALNRADVVTPDGIGIVYASKILGGHIKERAAGYDICCGIMERLAKRGGTAYFFGGKPGVADEAAKNAEIRFKGLTVCGTADGYFDEKREKEIIEDIRAKKPDLILVCLGMKKQEMWIDEHKDTLGAGILVGAGGSIDVLAGKAKRAPDIFIKFGLEWFYRLMKEPSRIGRMMQLPVFLLQIIVKRGK